jgi:hypothetical protein
MSTKTTEDAPKLLADIMRERPSDFDFSNVTEGPLTGTIQIQERTYTMSQMLGEFEFVKRDDVTGVKFYGRSPKLNGLRKFRELAEAPIDETGDMMEEVGGRAARLASLVLFIPNGDLWRVATAEEIGDAFDLNEMTEAIRQFSGRKREEDEGNATAPTTTQ